jgi:decaprenylphospho-beta-D-erythro-pentofuranosid-2-ulose 2-reductase
MKDALGSVQSVLVLGGTSEIALATARALAGERARRVVLAARDPQRAAAAGAPLEALGVAVETIAFDAADPAAHQSVVDDAFGRDGDLDVVLLAFGVLGDQERDETDAAATRAVIDVNYTAAASVMIAVTEALKAQGHGTLVVFSSVAAERPRRANFVYGSSKAGLDAFAQGLGDSLQGTGVSVMVVRPGFVHTRMTEGMDAAPFATTPDVVAEAVLGGLRSGAHTVWAPAKLRYVMAVLRHLPRPLFRKLGG